MVSSSASRSSGASRTAEGRPWTVTVTRSCCRLTRPTNSERWALASARVKNSLMVTSMTNVLPATRAVLCQDMVMDVRLEALALTHASALLTFELANRAFFAAHIADRGDDYFEHFGDRLTALVAEREAGPHCLSYSSTAPSGSSVGSTSPTSTDPETRNWAFVSLKPYKDEAWLPRVSGSPSIRRPARGLRGFRREHRSTTSPRSACSPDAVSHQRDRPRRRQGPRTPSSAT